MKKALLLITILLGIFVLGSLNSQKVFAQACGNGCGCYNGGCPSDRPNRTDLGTQCGSQTLCCSPSCPGEGGGALPPPPPPPPPPPANPPPAAPPAAPPPAAPPPVVVPPTATPIPTATLIPCPKKAQGDANCDGQVNLLDYFYYVAKKAGATLPATVNADFNANGTVDDADRTIVVRTLKP